jgi:predicted nucleotide-binding protein
VFLSARLGVAKSWYGGSNMKIFVSHALTDKELLNRLSHSLNPYGIKLFIAEHYISMTQTITQKIEKMIDQCDAALILLTQNGFNSNFVHQEIGYIKKAKKPSLNVVEDGFEDKITGFIYGNDYVKYDPKNPDSAVSIITNSFVDYYNKQKQIKESNQNIFIGLGLLVGALFLISSNED